MIRFAPIETLLSNAPYRSDAEWLTIYRHYACAVLQQKRPKEIMNGTGTIHHTSFAPFASEPGLESRRRLAWLFSCVGETGPSGAFLASLKIRKQVDLCRKIAMAQRLPKEFPKILWFEQCGRWFKKPGPNECHPEARWVMSSELGLNWQGRWTFDLVYGYPHDGSEWRVGIEQERREGADAFADRIDAWLVEQLEPETVNDWNRHYREQVWQTAYHGLRDVFYFGDLLGKAEYPDKRLADLLASVRGTSLTEGKISLSPAQYAVLRRWAEKGGANG